jgi:hypothetical protein
MMYNLDQSQSSKEENTVIVKPKETVFFKNSFRHSKLYDPYKKFSRLAKNYKAKDDSTRANKNKIEINVVSQNNPVDLP